MNKDIKIFEIKNRCKDGGSCELYSNIGFIDCKNKLGNPPSNGFYMDGKKVDENLLEKIKIAKQTFEEKEANDMLDRDIGNFNYLYKDKAIPKEIKHYNFMKPIIESMGINYEELLEDVRLMEKHKKFLIKYKLNKHINWYF